MRRRLILLSIILLLINCTVSKNYSGLTMEEIKLHYMYLTIESEQFLMRKMNHPIEDYCLEPCNVSSEAIIMDDYRLESVNTDRLIMERGLKGMELYKLGKTSFSLSCKIYADKMGNTILAKITETDLMLTELDKT